MKKILSTCLLATGMALSYSPANAMSAEDMFTKCGIGGMVFPNQPVIAAISNVTWDSGTTAVTSGLADAGCSGSSYESAKLVYQKYAALESETAIGYGDHIAALMDIYGCGASNQQVVLSATRSGFAEMVSDEAYSGSSRLDKAAAYHQIFDAAASGHCLG